VTDLAGKTALVTGAASGIGAATSRLLVRAGARVVLCDVDDRAGGELAAELGSDFVHLDVADPAGWSLLDVEPDLLLLNAGVVTGPTQLTLDDLTVENWDRLRRVNVDGTMYGILRFAGGMAARGGGAIVVTSSLTGLIGYAGDPLYAATKHFSVGLVRSLSGLLSPHGVTINAVCPDATDTGILTADQRTDWEHDLLGAEDVAITVVDLFGQDRSGQAWLVVKGRVPEPFHFGRVPVSNRGGPG